MVQLDGKMVKVLVSLLTANGGFVIGDEKEVIGEPSAHDLKSWSLRSAVIAESPVELQSSWVNDVYHDFQVNFEYILVLQAFPGGTRLPVWGPGTHSYVRLLRGSLRIRRFEINSRPIFYFQVGHTLIFNWIVCLSFSRRT